MLNQSVLFVMGPTAAGKTDLAIQLSEIYPLEVISVDSALIYQQMAIGTARPSDEELQKTPHHLIDFLDPSLSYSVANFRRDALDIISQIQQANKIPLLVGGTMLYHRALLYGLSELPASDETIRLKYEQFVKQQGSAVLHQKLEKVDPKCASKIHPNDPQRIIRALEVFDLTGQPLSLLQQQAEKTALPFSVKKIVLAPTREIIRERIKQRFMKMLELGFVEEVEKLYQRGDLSADTPSMRSVGYRQVWQYLAGDTNYEQMIELGINATRQFAKRQMTWLKKETDALWIEDLEAKENNLALIDRYLND